jgi:hypothetical protein
MSQNDIFVQAGLLVDRINAEQPWIWPCAAAVLVLVVCLWSRAQERAAEDSRRAQQLELDKIATRKHAPKSIHAGSGSDGVGAAEDAPERSKSWAAVHNLSTEAGARRPAPSAPNSSPPPRQGKLMRNPVGLGGLRTAEGKAAPQLTSAEQQQI